MPDVRLPSVLLHDHLDGGLRPDTVIDLARDIGYEGLPADDPLALATFFDQSRSGSLESYLQAFRHTIGVMQGHDSLERVAYEAAVDLAADGVVYAEIRFCPALHTRHGVTPVEVVTAVSSGLHRGAAETGLVWGLILDAMRQEHRSLEMARLAASTRHLGVVGFDLAGPEVGHSPREHLAACRHARASGVRLTIHAGEAAGVLGPAYIAEALEVCGAERIGHGVEVIRDCLLADGEIVDTGPVAARVLDRQTPLEMCPASNLATGRLAPEDHPIGMLYRAGFNVTINTDNRLMSSTTMSGEFDFVRTHHGFGLHDLARVTRRSLEAAFCDHATKLRLWEDRIAPAYVEVGALPGGEWR
ncbi:MAG: adenosine deaminase [Actinobacteria bacterium]|nr:adenosine deaminase [Actinomycetota bacterium]